MYDGVLLVFLSMGLFSALRVYPRASGSHNNHAKARQRLKYKNIEWSRLNF